jgi:hypothetical protein
MTIPSKILHSTTAGNIPTSLVSGQLAINEADRAIYYLDPQTGGPSSLLDQVNNLDVAINLIVNGGMEIDQINRGTVVATVNGYAIDMVKVQNSGAQVVSSQQITDAPPGLSKSLKASVTTANNSPGSTDFCAFSFPVEGYRAQRLGWGTIGPVSIAIGFWVKAFRVGVYGLNVSNNAGNRGYSTTFTVAVSATWQWVSVSIPGDVTGTWPVANGRSLIVSVFMMAGSGLMMTPNIWTAGGQQGVSAQINGIQSTTDFMQITGMCAFPGYVAPTFVRGTALTLPFSETLSLCQRFWQKSYDYETAVGATTQTGVSGYRTGNGLGNTVFGTYVGFSRVMMADPSVTIYSPGTGLSGKSFSNNTSLDNVAAPTVSHVGEKGFLCLVTTDTGNTAIDIVFHWVADVRM